MIDATQANFSAKEWMNGAVSGWLKNAGSFSCARIRGSVPPARVQKWGMVCISEFSNFGIPSELAATEHPPSWLGVWRAYANLVRLSHDSIARFIS